MIDAVSKRRSERSYAPKEVEKEKLEEIIWSGLFAPTSANRRPVHYIIVKDAETKKNLAKATKWGGFIADAPAAIVVCAEMAMDRGKRWVEDCSIAATHLMLEIEAQGLGGCWVQVREGDREDKNDAEQIVRDVLKIPKEYRVLCMLSLGYPKKKLPSHKKDEFQREFKERIHLEKF